MAANESTVSLLEWHHRFPGSVLWRLSDLGVEIHGGGVDRTAGRPVTVTRVWERYGSAINKSIRHNRMPAELVVATICTESGGRADAIRFEPGYVNDSETPHRVSPGLMQTLISTASEAMSMSVSRDWLLEPANSIEAGSRYMARQARQTLLDAPVVAAAYNAGSVKEQTGAQNRWKMRQYPIGTSAHCDRFVRFYNDAVWVLAQHSDRPAMSHQDFLRGLA